MLGRSLRGEGEHSHARFDAGHRLCGFGRANGDLRQLIGVGHGRHRHVTHHHHAVLTIFGGLREEEHGATHTSDAGGGFDDLEGRAKHIARGVERTGQLAVGIAGFDHQAAEIERIFHQHAGLFDRHSLLGAQLGEELRIFFFLGVVERIDHRGFVQVFKSVLFCQLSNCCGVPDQDEIGHTVGQDTVGGLNRAFFRAFGENDTLLVGSSASHQLFYQCHFMCVSIRLASVGFLTKSASAQIRCKCTKKNGANDVSHPFFQTALYIPTLLISSLSAPPQNLPTNPQNSTSFHPNPTVFSSFSSIFSDFIAFFLSPQGEGKISSRAHYAHTAIFRFLPSPLHQTHPNPYRTTH